MLMNEYRDQTRGKVKSNPKKSGDTISKMENEVGMKVRL